MKPAAWVLAVSLGLAGVAHATQDHYSDIDWVAAWSDPTVFVLERSSWSPEAGGEDLRTWWTFEQGGVVQATIRDPYSKTPWLQRPKKSTLPADKLEAVVAGLKAANRGKPRPRPKAVRDEVAPTLGITGLAAAKTCPVKVKIGKKAITVSSGTVSVEAGPSVVRVDHTMELDMQYDTVGESSVDLAPCRVRG
jgi:hypothetical protein